ncbi:MAG: molybdate ABC transporter substrate-binding protein [Chthoniobacterales bacterium]|nr:molybdate ABC transporter substrate-binding protein [Chthoniobacterales bacterium]
MKKILLLLALCASFSLRAEPVTITVSAAISLKAPLETLQTGFEKANPGTKVIYNFGSSGSLEQQIVNGAPVDVFISAAARQMDALEAAGGILPDSRFVLLGNTLVLIAPAGTKAPTGFGDLTSVRTLAIGEPQSVPAGMYAMEVLTHLRLAEAVRERLVYAKDVRQVLIYVESGNADAGIVYGSDAASSKAVRIVATAPEASHQKIEYPAAIVKASPHAAEATRFLEFLRSQEAAAVFKSAGFSVSSVP